MNKITARDRIKAAFRGQYLDRVPISTNCFKSEYIAKKTGFSRIEILTDPDKELKALELSQDEFPSDVIRVPADPLLPEAAAARRSLKKGQDVATPKRLLENKTAIETMQARDPRESKTFKPYLDMITRVKNIYPDHPAAILAPGVWSNAAELRGPETFLYDTVDDPDFVHRVLRFTTQLAKMRGEAMAEKGADLIVFGDPSAGCSLISPGIYKEFVKPYHREIFEHLKNQFDVWVGLHICGYTDPIMEDIASMPLDWFEIDSPSSLANAKTILGDKMIIRGNVETQAFVEGPEKNMAELVQTCINQGARGGRFVISPGCSIPSNMKPENTKAFLEATYKLGSVEKINQLLQL
jgi:uroporphyrinogen decarboxylase